MALFSSIGIAILVAFAFYGLYTYLEKGDDDK